MKPSFRLTGISLALLVAGIASAHATTTSTATTTETLATQSATMDRLATNRGASTVTGKFASSFAAFAGSQQNAQTIITGLRNGTPMTLTGTTTGATTTGSVTITPPTRPMGYGSAFIAMSLAKAQLAQYGITQPTPQQLQAALTGGTTTGTTTTTTGTTTNTVRLQGVLTQRASGMGWGQIANGMGVKLGTVVSAMKTQNHRLELEAKSEHHHADADEHHAMEHGKTKGVTTATGSKTEGEYKRGDKHSGITTAAGGSAGGSRGNDDRRGSRSGVTTAAGGSAGTYRHDGEHSHRSYDSGIVTAAGGSSVVASGGSRASGYEHSAGMVSASGAAVSGGISHADAGRSAEARGKKD